MGEGSKGKGPELGMCIVCSGNSMGHSEAGGFEWGEGGKYSQLQMKQHLWTW